MSTAPQPAVLLADDDLQLLRLFQRVLATEGYDVQTAADGDAAIDAFRSRRFDVVVSDIDMPGHSGIDILRAVRAEALDVPVILITGTDRLDNAIAAVEHGATRYLTKPVHQDLLRSAVAGALRAKRLADARRNLTSLPDAGPMQIGDIAGLEWRFSNALGLAYMEFQPIVSWSRHATFAYEALVRSTEPTIARPDALLDAADRLGKMADIGRRVRALCAQSSTPASDALLFINLHPSDLLDDDLFDSGAALTQIAQRVVLEITERARLETVPDVSSRIAMLRTRGFRVAIDDIGAGYAGLTSFAALEPEFVKLDRALIRDIDRSRTQTTLVEAMIRASRELGVQVIAEGIETAAERDTVVSLGCDLLQGYLFARPAKPFPEPRF